MSKGVDAAKPLEEKPSLSKSLFPLCQQKRISVPVTSSKGGTQPQPTPMQGKYKCL
jgi:hypothetical protein